MKAGDEVYTGKRLLVATGSSPVVPPIAGVKEAFDAGFVLTSREMLDIVRSTRKASSNRRRSNRT